MSSCQLFFSVLASFAFLTRHVPGPCHLFPSLLVCQRNYEPANPIKSVDSVLADFSSLQERQSRICDNLSDASFGAMRTGNFGDGFNTIKMSLCNHLDHLSRRSAVPETAQNKWARFARIISRAQGGPHDCRDTAISRLESP